MKPHYIVTLVAGDGIGPEIATALVKVFQAAEVPITWDPYNSPTNNPGTLGAIIESARKHKLMIKGPLATPIAEGPGSVNVALRLALGLYMASEPCVGLIDGLGLAPGANIGEECAMFEAMHGSALDIAGKGVANPTALILGGVLLLRHVRLHEKAARIEQAVRSVIARQEATTGDLGGCATTKEFTNAVIAALDEPAQESLLPSLAAGGASH